MASSSELIASLGRRGGNILGSKCQRTTVSATVLAAVPELVDVAIVVATSLHLLEFDEFCPFCGMEWYARSGVYIAVSGPKANG